MQEMDPKYFNKIDYIWLMDANLKRKENIEELMMEWQSDFEDLQNSIEEETSPNKQEFYRSSQNNFELVNSTSHVSSWYS